MKRKAKTTYYAELFKRYKFDIRNTWKSIRTLIGNDKSFIAQTFQVNNTNISDPETISNTFCDLFTNIGKTYADKIPNPSKPFEYYLTKHQKINDKSIFMSPTDPNEISSIIKSLKYKKSCTDDNISFILIKQLGPQVSDPIAKLINKSIISGVVPSSMKLAKVIPIYKAKAKNDISNYRPISILPTISKIMEKIIHKRLYTFLHTCDIFYPNQYGFRHQHSTIHAVTKLVSDIIKILKQKIQL